MRYFTKQWYNDTLVSQMCFSLRKTEKAGTFSEKFFESLYEIERKAYIRHTKRAAKFERRHFDVKSASAEFDANYKENLAFVERSLPREILDDIKDIRVLALGSVTHDMAARITRHCGRLNNECEATNRRYDEATDEVVARMGGRIPSLFGELVGAPIASVTIENDTACLTTSHEYTGVAVKVTLSGAKLVESDGDISGSMISNYEILTHGESGFEFSVLSLRDNLTLETLTLTAEAIEIEEI